MSRLLLKLEALYSRYLVNQLDSWVTCNCYGICASDCLFNLGNWQCAQIWQFFAFWASIQSRWQQLFYSNPPHC